jgi:hypothetical protein
MCYVPVDDGPMMARLVMDLGLKLIAIPIDSTLMRRSLSSGSRAGFPRQQSQSGSLPPAPVEVWADSTRLVHQNSAGNSAVSNSLRIGRGLLLWERQRPTIRETRAYVSFSNRPFGSSAFRLSATTVSMSLTGSCFSSESPPRPFCHGNCNRLQLQKLVHRHRHFHNPTTRD